MTSNIHFISAGAGSGKTYALTQKLEELLGSQVVNPAGVIATTFTRLAAGELKERVRQKLIESGKLTTANQMEQSLIATVNSVCGDLVRRFTFEAGLPPDQTVLEESQANVLYYQAMEQSLAGNIALVREMNALSDRLQIADTRTKQLLWRQEVKAIVDTARANNQGEDDIRNLGTASADTLLAHFPAASTRDLNQELLKAVSAALNGIDFQQDTTKGTYEYHTLLRGIQAALLKDSVTWAEWIKLSKTNATSKSKAFSEAIKDIAIDYDKHPQLRADVRHFAINAFQIAADSLQAYQQLKTRKGLIDFVDQEQQLYTLLDNTSVAATLRDELQLLMVDEFQDTSPIQLALFLKLAKLADKVIWVGDIKQSIYGFRGADPALMSAVVDRVVADGNPPEILEQSWRSRPELVEYVNALFVPAFSNTLNPQQVHLKPARKPYPQEIADEPAVECWQLVDSNIPKRASALTAGIKKLIASGRNIIDKQTETPRPITYADIAMLCRTNSHLADMATALAAANLPIRYKRAGLMATPEGCLALACLRRLIDPLDTLATAEIITLTNCENPESWIAHRLDYLNDADNRSHLWLTTEEGPIGNLNAQRQRLPFLTPVETLRVALDAAEVRKTVYSWGPSQQRAQHRLNNLSTLITHAEEYINQCSAQAEPATAAGLVLWLSALAEAEEDTQATGGDENAIQLVTHHGAKGLEWPIVITMDMDATLKPRMWSLTVLPSSDPVDLDDPLQGRILRYWPRFQGAQKSNIPLVEQIEASPEGTVAMEVETEESKRLLYVSLTRARDDLIITMNKTATSGEWMGTLGAEWMLPQDDILTLPNEQQIPSRYLRLEVTEDDSTTPDYKPNWLAETTSLGDKLRLKTSPSSAPPIANAAIGKVIELGDRLPIEGQYEPAALGSALHAVIACYINGNQQQETIERILTDHDMQDALTAETAIESAKRLLSAIEENFSPISYATEYPIQYRNQDGQLLSGWIDLLLETEAGSIIIDHKASPRTREDWAEVALGYSGQLEAYAEAAEAATGNTTRSCWIHFGVTGGLVEVLR